MNIAKGNDAKRLPLSIRFRLHFVGTNFDIDRKDFMSWMFLRNFKLNFNVQP